MQCPDAHLFCMECARRAAEETIGNSKVVRQCDYIALVSRGIFPYALGSLLCGSKRLQGGMNSRTCPYRTTAYHSYNCKPFPISEVRRFLPAKTIDRWESIKQDKAIKEAGIEGLEVSVIVALSVSLMPILHVNVVVPILPLFRHY